MKKQKDTFLLVCSLLLVAACLFSLFASVKGFNEFLAIKEYKTNERTEGLAAIDTAVSGIKQLKENEGKYNAGVSTYNAGLATYAAGQQSLAAGAAKLQKGEADYAAGQQTLANGKQQYAEGKATLDSNTEAYNKGKSQLTLLKPIYDIAKNSGTSTSIGDTIVSKYEDGQSQIKQYEDGQQQLAQAATQISQGEASLAQGKADLQKGYAEYNAGVDQLNAGAASLADGKKQLSVFEEGSAQLAAGMATLMSTGPVYKHDGETIAVPGVASRLGENFSYWTLNDDGSVKTVNGQQYLNLDNCMKVCDAGRAFIEDQTADVTHELMGRAILYVVTAVLLIFGTVVGIMGADAAFVPTRLEKVTFLGMVLTVLAIAANVYGLIGGYNGYTYPMEDGTYSGTLQMIAIITLAAAAALFAAIGFASLTDYKKTLPAEIGEGGTEPADTDGEAVDGIVMELDDSTIDAEPVAQEIPEPEIAPASDTHQTPVAAANADKLHKLEKEEEELKKMLASLSSKINEIKGPVA